MNKRGCLWMVSAIAERSCCFAASSAASYAVHQIEQGNS